MVVLTYTLISIFHYCMVQALSICIRALTKLRVTKIFFYIAWWVVCYKTSLLQDVKSKESIFIPESKTG